MAQAKDQKPFLTDIQTIRERARHHIMMGAVTESYGGNAKLACEILNAALATEIICVLRYKRHYFMAKGIHAGSVKGQFLEHAGEEQEHADRIAERIVQLGGAPDFSPSGLLSRSHSEYIEGETLVDMMKEDLVAERVAIESYREMVAHFAKFDTTTRQMLEEILAVEEEHADELAELLERIPQENSGPNA